MTLLQLLLLAGAMIGAGVALGVAALAPAPPHLGDTIARLRPGAIRSVADTQTGMDFETRLGGWAQRTLPPQLLGNRADADLAILGSTASQLYGAKLFLAMVGLAAGPVLAAIIHLWIAPLPFVIPPIVGIVLAAVLWTVPSSELKDKARKARAEFRLTLTAYLEMVALERLSGSGTRQALQRAAAIGDSWACDLISEELARTRWSGQSPWDALDELGQRIGVAELGELADIMRLGGEEGTQTYDQLRARAKSSRNTLLTEQVAATNIRNQRMAFPVTMMVAVVAAIIIIPALLRLM